ncbi:MAG: response regulator [Chloroflexota bacterium]|nr:response regulator [Chloroflexota bacterium]
MSSATRSVVVFNDDEMFLELMQSLLHDEGFCVATRRDWDDGHAFVKTRRPDLVVMDIVRNLREVGWTMFDRLKADPSTRGIPVIVCTASHATIDRNRDRLVEHGDAYVLKPFDIDEFLGVVRRLLGPDVLRVASST